MKGATGEREVVKLARRAGFKKAQSTGRMQRGYDPQAREWPDVTGVSVCWIEVKRARRVNIRRAFRALERVGAAFPVLAHRDDHDSKWRATLHLETLLTLVRACRGKDEPERTIRGAARKGARPNRRT